MMMKEDGISYRVCVPVVVVVVLIVVSVYYAFSGGEVGPVENEPIKIGCVLSFEPRYASGSKTVLRGYDLALADKNHRVLGRPVKLIVKNADQSEDVINVTLAMIEEGCKVFIGPYGEDIVEYESGVTEDYEIPLIDCISWADYLTERDFKYYFRLPAPCVSRYVPDMADKINNLWLPKLGLSKDEVRVGILYMDLLSYAGEGLAARLEDLGIHPVYLEVYTYPVTDWTDVIETLKTKDLDIFVPAMGAATNIAIFIRQSAALGFDPPILYAEGCGWEHPDLAAIFESEPEVLEGFFTHSYPSTSANFEPAEELGEKFYETYGIYPTIHATEGYWGMTFLLDMIEEAGSNDSQAIWAAIKNADIPRKKQPMYWGVQFDEKNQNTRSDIFQVAQYHTIDGKPRLVWVYPLELALREMIETWKE